MDFRKLFLSVILVGALVFDLNLEAFAGSGSFNLHYASAAPTSANVVHQEFNFVSGTANLNISVPSFVKGNNSATVYVKCYKLVNDSVVILSEDNKNSAFSSSTTCDKYIRIYVVAELRGYTTGGYTALGSVSA